MSFGSATWKYVSAKRGEMSIVIKGDNMNDVESLSKWFEENNKLKTKEEYDGQILMTFSQFEIKSPEEKNPQFGDATWGLVDGGTTVVIQGKDEDHVHNLADWFVDNNTVENVGFEICIRFKNSPILTPSTNHWESDRDSDYEGDSENEGDEGDLEGDESEEK
jgi:hypothetical protein